MVTYNSDLLDRQQNRTHEYIVRLLDLLGKSEQGQWSGLPRLTGWRFTLSNGRSLSFSIVDNDLGDIYGPPTSRDSLSGGLYLIWEDNRRTNTTLDRHTILNFDQLIREWRVMAYAEEHGADIMAPGVYPEIPMLDEKLLPLVEGDTTIFYQILRQGQKELLDSGAEIVDASTNASLTTSYVCNSKGLNLSYSSTGFSFSFFADNLYGNGYSKRRLHPDGEVEYVLNDIKTTLPYFKKKGQLEGTAQEETIVLGSNVAVSFISTYLLSNLYGSRVVNGQSAFSAQAFKERKLWLRPDISLFLDGLRPYEFSAGRLTAEGVPGGRVALIDHGRLSTPILDLKYAGLIGLAPTPAGSLYLEVDEPQKITLSELVRPIERGLLIYNLMGMHTQDSTSGRYSVSAPKSLVINNGEFTGTVKTTLNGNFFENLNDERLGFGWDPREDNPAIKLFCNISGTE